MKRIVTILTIMCFIFGTFATYTSVNAITITQSDFTESFNKISKNGVKIEGTRKTNIEAADGVSVEGSGNFDISYSETISYDDDYPIAKDGKISMKNYGNIATYTIEDNKCNLVFNNEIDYNNMEELNLALVAYLYNQISTIFYLAVADCSKADLNCAFDYYASNLKETGTTNENYSYDIDSELVNYSLKVNYIQKSITGELTINDLEEIAKLNTNSKNTKVTILEETKKNTEEKNNDKDKENPKGTTPNINNNPQVVKNNSILEENTAKGELPKAGANIKMIIGTIILVFMTIIITGGKINKYKDIS